MTSNVDRLLGEIHACRICAAHLPLGCRPVLQASASARVLIVSQAPGRKVHETGIPFNDPSGERLRDWMGIDRDSFLDPRKVAIVPMGFCFPGSGRSGDLPPRPECAPTWHPRLMPMLTKIRLTLLIGRYAQLGLLGRQGGHNLTQTVEAWREHLGNGILPLPHPSPRNQGWFKHHPWFLAEVVPALREQVRVALR